MVEQGGRDNLSGDHRSHQRSWTIGQQAAVEGMPASSTGYNQRNHTGEQTCCKQVVTLAPEPMPVYEMLQL